MDKIDTTQPYGNLQENKNMDNGLIRGLDLSIVQGMNVDFNTIAQSGVQFVISKCGDGNDGFDSAYQHNINSAQSAGLEVATYHFVYPLPDSAGHPNRNPVDQARLHFSKCITDVVAMDLEYPAYQDWAKWGCSASQINDWGLVYLQEYERLSGKKPLIYTYPFFANNVKFTSDYTNYQLWIASYVPDKPSVPAPWGQDDWVIWQTGGGNLGHLPNGAPVDTNLAKDLSLWGK